MFDMLPITESKHCSPIEINLLASIHHRNFDHSAKVLLVVEAIQSRHSLLVCTCGKNSSVSCSRNIIIVQGKLLAGKTFCAEKVSYIVISVEARIYV